MIVFNDFFDGSKGVIDCGRPTHTISVGISDAQPPEKQGSQQTNKSVEPWFSEVLPTSNIPPHIGLLRRRDMPFSLKLCPPQIEGPLELTKVHDNQSPCRGSCTPYPFLHNGRATRRRQFLSFLVFFLDLKIHPNANQLHPMLPQPSFICLKHC